MYIPSSKIKIDCHDSKLYWPTTIEDTMQWFTFISITEHTANILNPKQGLITSLIRVFSMFELHLIDDEEKLEAIAIRCINCKKETGFFLRTSTFKEMITKSVLNAILHHLDMS